MNDNESGIKIPCTAFYGVIYTLFGETEDHVQLIMEQEGKKFSAYFDDENKMRAFIQKPLTHYWEGLRDFEKEDLRHILQFLLNHDEHTPYVVANPRYSNLLEKKGSQAQRWRDSCQDTMTPNDGYALCQWIWDSLFPGEDWHTDISNWVVVDSNGVIQSTNPLPEVPPEPTPKKSFFAKLFG